MIYNVVGRQRSRTLAMIYNVVGRQRNLGLTYGVLLCVKFNKKNTFDGFEGLQGLWTGGGRGWDFRPDRFFSRLKSGQEIKKEKLPPLSPLQ